jgi:hypothetical protein
MPVRLKASAKRSKIQIGLPGLLKKEVIDSVIFRKKKAFKVRM